MKSNLYTVLLTIFVMMPLQAEPKTDGLDISVEYSTKQELEQLTKCKQIAAQFSNGLFVETTDSDGTEKTVYVRSDYDPPKELTFPARYLYMLAHNINLCTLTLRNTTTAKQLVYPALLIKEHIKGKHVDRSSVKKDFEQVVNKVPSHVLLKMVCLSVFLIPVFLLSGFFPLHMSAQSGFFPQILINFDFIHPHNDFIYALAICTPLLGAVYCGYLILVHFLRAFLQKGVFRTFCNSLGIRLISENSDEIECFGDDIPAVIELSPGQALQVRQIVKKDQPLIADKDGHQKQATHTKISDHSGSETNE